MNQIEQFRLAAICLEHLSSEGFCLKQTSSPLLARQWIAEVGKSYLTPFLDPENNDFTERNHFWLSLQKDGRAVLIGGARFDVLEGEPITEFWRRTNRRNYKVGAEDPVQTFSPLCDDAIVGRVVYLGDMYGIPEVRGSVNRLRCFLAIAHLAVMSKWAPDTIYAFMRQGDMDRGADRNYGFLNAIPAAQVWAYKAPHRASSEWCVYNRKTELGHAVVALVERIVREIAKGAARD